MKSKKVTDEFRGGFETCTRYSEIDGKQQNKNNGFRLF